MAPDGYPGEYLTSKELFNTLDTGFKNAGFVNWSLTINGKELTPHTEIKVPRKEDITIHLEGEVKVVAKILNAKKDTLHFEANRTMISNFAEREGGGTIIK